MKWRNPGLGDPERLALLARPNDSARLAAGPSGLAVGGGSTWLDDPRGWWSAKTPGTCVCSPARSLPAIRA